jgi:SAM-dependent methyltransferase
MTLCLLRARALAAALAPLLLLAACALAPEEPEFEPESGQAGKDVVWVPTPDALVERMLDMAQVTAQDTVIDLGSGDGRTVIAAARRGARALGIEFNPEMVALSRRNARRAGVETRARFEQADLFETDFSEATVITMFLLPSINLKLRPRILAMRPGTRVVSNSFNMDAWEPDLTVSLSREQGCAASWCTAHFWIVPAQFAGTYRLPFGELTLEQRFQMLDGTLRTPAGAEVVSGKVQGTEAYFTAGGRAYRARREGMELKLLP